MPKDVIFVPGLPASELWCPGPRGGLEKIFVRTLRRLGELLWKAVDTRLLGPDDLLAADPVQAGDPVDKTRVFIIDQKQARSLYDLLRDECGLSGSRIHRVGWDWRRPVTDKQASDRLTAKIAGAPVGSVLILHSTGGLVARAVLKKNPALCNRLSAVVAFGVPWVGTLKSMAVLLKKENLAAADRNDARKVMAHSWASIDLLPRENAGLTLKGNGQPYDLFGSVDWLPASPQWLRSKVKRRLDHSLNTMGVPSPQWQFPVGLHNVAGFGELTNVTARISGGQVDFNVTASGAPLGFEEARQGDGTIPFNSAASAHGVGVVSWRVPVGAYRKMGKDRHSSLWSNPGAIKLLRHLVGELPQEPLIELALDTSAYSPGTEIRLRYSLQDAGGQAMSGQLKILSPASPAGTHTFNTNPSGFGTAVLDRSVFQEVEIGGSTKRRIQVELTCAAGQTDIFAVVPK